MFRGNKNPLFFIFFLLFLTFLLFAILFIGEKRIKFKALPSTAQPKVEKGKTFSPPKVSSVDRAEIIEVNTEASPPYLIIQPLLEELPFNFDLPQQIKVLITPSTQLFKIVKHQSTEIGEVKNLFLEAELKDLQKGLKVGVEFEGDIRDNSEILAKTIWIIRI